MSNYQTIDEYLEGTGVLISHGFREVVARQPDNTRKEYLDMCCREYALLSTNEEILRDEVERGRLRNLWKVLDSSCEYWGHSGELLPPPPPA